MRGFLVTIQYTFLFLYSLKCATKLGRGWWGDRSIMRQDRSTSVRNHIHTEYDIPFNPHTTCTGYSFLGVEGSGSSTLVAKMKNYEELCICWPTFLLWRDDWSQESLLSCVILKRNEQCWTSSILKRFVKRVSLSRKTLLWNKVHDCMFFASEAVRFVLHLKFLQYTVHITWTVSFPKTSCWNRPQTALLHLPSKHFNCYSGSCSSWVNSFAYSQEDDDEDNNDSVVNRPACVYNFYTCSTYWN